MRVHLDPQRLAQRGKQVFLVHLGITLHCIVLLVLGDVPELSDGLAFQLFICMSHAISPWSRTRSIKQSTTSSGAHVHLEAGKWKHPGDMIDDVDLARVDARLQ